MINKRLDNINRIIEQQSRFQQISASQSNIQKMLEPSQRLIDSAKHFAHMNSLIERMRTIDSRIPFLNSALFEQADKINRIQERIDLFNKKLPDDLISIANYGWYLDFQTDFGLSAMLANYIKVNEIEKLDKYLCDYYTNNFDNIILRLSTNHQNRAKLFNDLKIAFDSEYYNLLIPLILSQIDGVCYDYTKKLFFIKNSKKEKNPYLPKVSNELVVFNNEFLKAFLAPFFKDSPIFAHQDKLDLFPTSFNRHLVLHGIDTDYGTKSNSLKAFSLLSYCDDVLNRIIKEVDISKK